MSTSTFLPPDLGNRMDRSRAVIKREPQWVRSGRGTPFCADCGEEKIGRTLFAARCLACQHRHRLKQMKRYNGTRTA